MSRHTARKRQLIWGDEGRRRRAIDPTAPLVRCPSCGFTASLVTAPGHPDLSPWERLRLLIESGCTGCPACPADLDLELPPPRPVTALRTSLWADVTPGPECASG